jgi:hypothetical protein
MGLARSKSMQGHIRPHDCRFISARWHESQSGTRQAGLVLVVSKICTGGYGAGRVRKQSPRGEEGRVGRSAVGATVGVGETTQVAFLGNDQSECGEHRPRLHCRTTPSHILQRRSRPLQNGPRLTPLRGNSFRSCAPGPVPLLFSQSGLSQAEW